MVCLLIGLRSGVFTNEFAAFDADELRFRVFFVGAIASV